MKILLYIFSIIIILLSFFLFKERINRYGIIGIIICLVGVIAVLTKGNFNNLLTLKFTSGDLWIAGAMISWAIYSIYLMNFRSKFDLTTRFALMIFFGILCIIPLYIVESNFFFSTNFDFNFFKWTRKT